MGTDTAEPPLAALLRRAIAAGGPIGLPAYMALALGHPRHGYYATRDPFGARGDFTTAPEISQTFGESLAVWCALAWRDAGAPAPVRLVELGPGRGTLMADVLRTLDRIAPDLAAAADLHLVEASPVLRAKQQAALAGRRAAWHEALAPVPDGPLLLVANEFFDALPIAQFIKQGDGWRERRVDWDEEAGRLVFRAGAPLPGLVPAALREAPDGSVYETGAVAAAVAGEIGARLAAAGGAALIVDYGKRFTAAGDTLAAIQGARKDADPLAAPGAADLSAHVDFEALADAFSRAGAAPWGPVAQRDLLLRLGIEARRDALAAKAPPARAAALRAGVRRLIAPDAMGTLFLALAVTAPNAPPPPAFEAAAP